MANNETQNQENKIDELNDHLTSASEKLANNKKIIFWALAVVVLVAVGVVSYIFMYRNPTNQKAVDALGKVQTTATSDTVAAKEYQKVADQFKGTDSGNIAAFNAAVSYYHIGKYKEALSNLEKFETTDDVLAANADILMGDCYVNLKKYPEALEAFDKGIKTADGNEQIVPRAQMKKAVVFDELKKYQEALDCYEAIKAEFPGFAPGSGMSIEGYIAREKARIGK